MKGSWSYQRQHDKDNFGTKLFQLCLKFVSNLSQICVRGCTVRSLICLKFVSKLCKFRFRERQLESSNLSKICLFDCLLLGSLEKNLSLRLSAPGNPHAATGSAAPCSRCLGSLSSRPTTALATRCAPRNPPLG